MDSLTTKRDWGYKWTPALYRILHEGVKGPLTQPMLAVPFPCTFEDDTEMFNCEEEVKKCYHRRGIPDTWNEYVLVKKGCLIPDDLPKKDVKITKHLWQNYRMDFGQGIPDPWKRCVTQVDAYNRNYKPNIQMYEADKIRCPNCDKELLIYCLNEFSESKKEEPMQEKSVEGTPVQETISQKKTFKDACVETDEVEIKMDETCDHKDHKSKYSSKAEYTTWRVTKPKKCRFREEDKPSDSCCSCPHRIHPYGSRRDVHAPICVHNFLPLLPTSQQNEMHFTPPMTNTDQQKYQPPSNSKFPTQWESYPWFSPGFFASGCRGNGHFLELKLVCPKCKAGKKKRRKGKHKPANTNLLRNECIPCCCKNERDYSSKPFVNDDDSGIYKITRVRNRPICNCDERASSNTAKGKQSDRDFIQLLQMLGYNDLHGNKRNTIYDESVINLDPLDIVGTSKRATQAYKSPSGFPNPKITHWKSPRRRQTPFRNGLKYTFDNVGKTVVYQNRNSDTVPNCSVSDKNQNMNRSKELEKKLSSFMSNRDTFYSDGDNSSSETEQRKSSKPRKMIE